MLICQYQLKTPALYLNLLFSVQPLALIPKNFLLKKNPTISKNHFSTLIFRRPHLMLFNKLPVAPVRGQLL